MRQDRHAPPRLSISDSHLPEDAPWKGLAHTQLGRMLVVAIVIAMAAVLVA